MKFYRGAPAAARAYVERDRSRADDYYLSEGTGVATRLAATPDDGVEHVGELTGDAYEQWVAGIDIESEKPKGRLRGDAGPSCFPTPRSRSPRSHPMTAQPTIPNPRRNPGDEMLTLQEACAFLRVPEGTLRYWRHLGCGPRSFKVGRHVRYWRRGPRPLAR